MMYYLGLQFESVVFIVGDIMVVDVVDSWLYSQEVRNYGCQCLIRFFFFDLVRDFSFWDGVVMFIQYFILVI